MKYLEYAKHVGADEYVLSWVEHTLANYLEKNNPSTDEVEHIIDYLAQTKTKISQMSYKEAKSNAEKWTKSLQKKGKHIKETEKDTEVVLDFKDGFKIVKLIGKNAYEREGYLMRSCVASYYGKKAEIYSLRDKDNNPHCTMEKNQQVKGKGNGEIHPKYVLYVVKFLEHIGMTVGDSEMAHLGYVNIEKIQKEEPDLKFPELYQGKYFYKENLSKVENKDRISLWNVFGLFEFDTKMRVKFNFDIEKSGEWLRQKLSKIEKKGSYNRGRYRRVAMTSGNEVAMTSDNKVAMTYGNKVAMTDNNEVAMTDNNEVAMTNYNKVAMTNYNKVAMTNCNKVAMTNCNKVAMTSDNKVAMTSDNKVAMTDGNKVAMTSGNKVAMTNYNKVAMTYGNKVAMTSGNKVAMTDGNKVAMTNCNKVAMTDYNEVKATIDNIMVGRERNKIEVESKSVIVMGNESWIKGKKGTLLVFYEKDKDGNITNHNSAIIDGEKIKEDTWYMLKNKKIVEVKA